MKSHGLENDWAQESRSAHDARGMPTQLFVRDNFTKVNFFFASGKLHNRSSRFSRTAIQAVPIDRLKGYVLPGSRRMIRT